MADFVAADKIVALWEGSYSNDPNDAGKETCCGISRVNNPTWPGWVEVDRLKTLPAFPLTIKTDLAIQSAVHDFYLRIWNTYGLDLICSQLVAQWIFGGVVNQGPHHLITWLQEALNALNPNPLVDLAMDGVYGLNTEQRLIEVLEKQGDHLLLEGLKAKREAGYWMDALAPHNRGYLGGWENRLQAGG